MPPLNVAVELFYDGAWHDIIASNNDVLAEEPIVITRGQGDESAAPRPCSITMRLANDDDQYRTSNPLSPLYGKAGLNTPVRVKVGGVVRGIVEASSWRAGQTPDFRQSPRRGNAWVDFQGGGILQRINGWTEVLKSPFRQYNETLPHIIGYWPAEQARGSTDLISTVPGTRKYLFLDMAFDSQYKPPGSAPLMDFGQSDDAEVDYIFPRSTGADPTVGWQLSWAGRYGPIAAGPQTIMGWGVADGTTWDLSLNPTTGQMILQSFSSLASGLTPIVNFSASYNGYDWSQWTLFSIDAQYAAGTTTMWVNWVNADLTQSGFITTTFSGVPSLLDGQQWDMSTFDGIPAGSTVGHITGANVSSVNGVNLFDNARKQAWAGYGGETAADRFARLCVLKGVPYYVSSGYAASMPMGPQSVATFPQHVAEIAVSDDALLFDVRDELKIILLTRADRYNQTPALNLIPTNLPALPTEVTDDLPAHNIITVSQRDGGDYTAEDDTGPLGTQPPPAGIGDARQTVNVNVDAEAVMGPLLAGYWLNLGTVDLPRFPSVTVDLTALSPAKITEIEAVNIGSVITITGMRENVIRLYVLGYTETITWPIRRTITFVCAPDLPYVVAVLDTDRADSGSTILKTAVTSTGTALVFRTSNPGDLWSTTTPYDVMISGERCTVTAMGAAALVSGAYDQAATVTRAVNGIVKALAANEPITVVNPARCAL